MTICLDFFVKENLRQLLDPHANIIFVPAMSSSLKKMEAANVSLGNFGAASAFCSNSCWIVTGGDKGNFNPKNAGYIYIPCKNGFRRLNCRPECGCSECTPEIFRVSQI